MQPSSRKSGVIDPGVVRRARDQILGCGACSESADTPFYWVLDSIANIESASARHAAIDAVTCPKCNAPVGGETLVHWE